MKSFGGRFIVIDGGEGCGKSTQSALLRDRIARDGMADVLLVREPGTTRIGERVRSLLLDPEAGAGMNMRCEMLLYMAARAQLVAEVIAPALDAGKCVVCDRFVSSTLAYQLGGDGLTKEEIRKVADVAVHGHWPDLTVILDMPPGASHARVARAKDRIEQRPLEYHERVRENFILQANDDSGRYGVVAADRDVQAVHEEIWRLVSERMLKIAATAG